LNFSPACSAAATEVKTAKPRPFSAQPTENQRNQILLNYFKSYTKLDC
jgi:hypothetical protein